MPEAQTTPGPWIVGAYVPADGRSGLTLAVWREGMKPGQKGTPVCLISPADAVNEHDEANASLIAAAPDLLEACGWLVAALEEHDADEEVATILEKARAAIAKAEGQTN